MHTKKLKKLRIGIQFSVFLLCFLLAGGALSLPPHATIETSQGSYQAFALEEFKILLDMEADLLSYRDQIVQYKNALENYKLIVVAKDDLIRGKDEEISILKVENERLMTKWTEENKLRLQAENKPTAGFGAMGAIIGATVVVGLVIFVLVVAAR